MLPDRSQPLRATAGSRLGLTRASDPDQGTPETMLQARSHSPLGVGIQVWSWLQAAVRRRRGVWLLSNGKPTFEPQCQLLILLLQLHAG